MKSNKAGRRGQISLLDGCYCSRFTVFPENWDKPGANPNCTWYINYRFYDPSLKDVPPYHGVKQVLIKGMNTLGTLVEKREAVSKLIRAEKIELFHKAWNPIRKIYMKEPEEEIDYEVHPDTPLVDALARAVDLKICADSTKIDLRSVVKYSCQAAALARIDQKPIKSIKRRHILMIMSQLAVLRGDKWTANLYNYYRSHLKMAFQVLRKYDALEHNPIDELVEKAKVVKGKRKVLSQEECDKIDKWVREYDMRLWMLIHIFFHSGARTTEIFRVQGKDVNLIKQEVSYFVKKGRGGYVWVTRPIKDIVLPLWQAAMTGCGSQDYVFSSGLKPGASAISSKQMSRRWKRHIKGDPEKGKLGIDCDWYSLKHLNTTQTVALIGTKLAALQNAESEAMINGHYDVMKEDRDLQVMKKVANSFASGG